MKSYTTTEPAFSDTINITEVTDPGHADYINQAPKQLLENTLVNRSEIDRLKEEAVEYLEKTGDSAENIVTFESGDNENATSWTDVPVMKSKEKHKSLLKKISTMFRNVRFLYKLLGNKDISKIADGTVTGVLKEFKDGKVNIISILKTMEQVDANTSDENIVNALVFKALKMDLMNSIEQINSNLAAVEIYDFETEAAFLNGTTFYPSSNAWFPRNKIYKYGRVCWLNLGVDISNVTGAGIYQLNIVVNIPQKFLPLSTVWARIDGVDRGFYKDGLIYGANKNFEKYPTWSDMENPLVFNLIYICA